MDSRRAPASRHDAGQPAGTPADAPTGTSAGPPRAARANAVLSVAVLGLSLAAVAAVVPQHLAAGRDEAIRKGPGVTAVRRLSEWFPGIRGTSGDTDVYVLDSGRPGATALVLGGTHGNEPAGYLTAIVLVENAAAAEGSVIVIPHANRSSMTHTDYQEASPRLLEFQGASGRRTFRFGSRATNPTDQWPDPDIYVHASSGQQLSGAETRNLNRAYPGRPDGTFTERIAFAITSLVRAERVDLVIDLHEASPEYPVVNAIVAHERAMKVASGAVLNLEFDDITIGLEPSPKNLRGLSHRELGDATGALALLCETSNVSQGRLRGATGARQVIEGTDDKYLRAARLGRLAVPFDERGWPLKQRVGRHAASVGAILASYTSANPGRPVSLRGLPSYADLMARGLEPFL
ncbi:MAG TPA: succinylglutamate desuccinylase/aspartoacylase family protein [Vicinamibacterales bacterium]|nr:succinylglutamate desuccinylase/aspartoacylase family protein [Vicinamibacterales bacterium]HPW19804.1 succinylglutamate desuccinylase/aspartoacylase family protein [Vicinamibacterales bacterium]